jgi:hypothetical protein
MAKGSLRAVRTVDPCPFARIWSRQFRQLRYGWVQDQTISIDWKPLPVPENQVAGATLVVDRLPLDTFDLVVTNNSEVAVALHQATRSVPSCLSRPVIRMRSCWFRIWRIRSATPQA